MEAFNQFTCLSYDTIDFLIHSKYVLFGIYLQNNIEDKKVTFENEILPHINIGSFLEEKFSCKKNRDCNVMLIMAKTDLDKTLQNEIVKYTNTNFPLSGNFSLSVNSDISTKEIDLADLKMIPEGIRNREKICGISAIGFSKKNMLLISPDNIIRTFIGDRK